MSFAVYSAKLIYWSLSKFELLIINQTQLSAKIRF